MTKRKRKRKRKLRVKVRDWLAVRAWFRKSGPMRNKKKEKSKKRCRGKEVDE